jgi:diguanylate cyclase (GGDEF)-like protein
MAGQLKFLEEMNLDTSPLTRLPGGTTIEKEMKQRIRINAQIAFCLMDIDNFKAYNDHYGYARGNELIQATADIISKAVATHGRETDFIGHIGGDDFVVITAPNSYKKICGTIIENFDKEIPGHYDTKDRKRGHISGEDRQGNKGSFPLATISIAVVTNEKRKLLNHIEFGEAAAEMKTQAKSTSGSLFLVDRRHNMGGTQNNRKVINIQMHKSGEQEETEDASITAKGSK